MSWVAVTSPAASRVEVSVPKPISASYVLGSSSGTAAAGWPARRRAPARRWRRGRGCRSGRPCGCRGCPATWPPRRGTSSRPPCRRPRCRRARRRRRARARAVGRRTVVGSAAGRVDDVRRCRRRGCAAPRRGGTRSAGSCGPGSSRFTDPLDPPADRPRAPRRPRRRGPRCLGHQGRVVHLGRGQVVVDVDPVTVTSRGARRRAARARWPRSRGSSPRCGRCGGTACERNVGPCRHSYHEAPRRITPSSQRPLDRRGPRTSGRDHTKRSTSSASSTRTCAADPDTMATPIDASCQASWWSTSATEIRWRERIPSTIGRTCDRLAFNERATREGGGRSERPARARRAPTDAARCAGSPAGRTSR